MSKQGKRNKSRGELWFHPARRDLVRKAFEEGVRRLSDQEFRKAIVAGSQVHWAGMAVLKPKEKEHVYADIRAFARADLYPAEIEAMKTVILNPPKTTFVQKVRSFFGA